MKNEIIIPFPFNTSLMKEVLKGNGEYPLDFSYGTYPLTRPYKIVQFLGCQVGGFSRRELSDFLEQEQIYELSRIYKI